MNSRRTFLSAGIGAAALWALDPAFGQPLDLSGLSLKKVMTLSWTLDHVGPMCKTVEDAARPARGNRWRRRRRMKQVSVHEAKTHLSRLLNEVAAGDEVVIANFEK